MHLSKINNTFQHRISGGDEYLWTCWPDARFIEYESEHAHASVVFSSLTQIVYNAEISVKPINNIEDKYPPYRWLNPRFKDAMIAEATKRGISINEAWDDVMWCDLEVEEDFLEKAEGIFTGKEIDTRVQVHLDLEDDLMLQLAMNAHEQDITLNKMVERILNEVILAHKKTVTDLVLNR